MLELLVKSKGDVVIGLRHGSHSRLSIWTHAREQVLTDLSRISCYKLILLRLNVADKLVKVFEFFSEAVFIVEHHAECKATLLFLFNTLHKVVVNRLGIMFGPP